MQNEIENNEITVTINSCYGGFSLSNEAILRLYELKKAGNEISSLEVIAAMDYWGKGWEKELEQAKNKRNFYSVCPLPIVDESNISYVVRWNDNRDYDSRANKFLIQVIEELGEKANGRFSSLRLVKIPADVEWEISEYDGLEHVAEVHNTWS